MIDVLVIGSGGAGLSAALSAKKNRVNVTVLSKTYPTHSQTTQAQGGINAVLDDTKDSVESHINDTLKSSHGLGNKQSIEILCKNAKTTIEWLDKIGVPFSRSEEGKICQRELGGATRPRACYSSDYTGLKILHTLYDNCIKEQISFLNEYMLLNIIVEENRAKGVTALNIASGEVEEILAKSVILATGGYSGLYHNFTTNSYATTGDGVAAAVRAGCRLKNMEFVQFHPTALKKSRILISESARGEGGYLVDSNGNRFIDELKPRDEVARAIYNKIKEGKEVFLDLRHLGRDKIEEAMPQERRIVLEFENLKMENELIPIEPAAHYSMGGIKTNSKCETNIKNLYACGECSESGVHGANRLGGNSLLEIILFGKIAGSQASNSTKDISEEYLSNTKQFQKDKDFINSVYDHSNQINFYEKRDYMGKIFFENVGLFRTQMNLKEVLSQIGQWQEELNFMGIGDKSKIYNKNLVEFIEFRNMLELSEIVVVSALKRCESRGAHFRSDHPLEIGSYIKESQAWKINGTLAVE